MNFPNTLRDIPLKNYQEFLKIQDPSNDDLIKCILNISDTQLNRFKSKEIEALLIHLSDLLENREDTFIPRFHLNGVEYGFIPNLDDITYGENKDLTSYINDYQTMHKAMAVAYRPIKHKQGDKYIIEDYKGSVLYSEIMKDAPLDVVLGMVVFFYNLTSELLKVTQKYLSKEMEKEIALAENGEDIANYTRLAKVILGDLQTSLN